MAVGLGLEAKKLRWLQRDSLVSNLASLQALSCPSLTKGKHPLKHTHHLGYQRLWHRPCKPPVYPSCPTSPALPVSTHLSR